jgi:hypothetical protein
MPMVERPAREIHQLKNLLYAGGLPPLCLLGVLSLTRNTSAYILSHCGGSSEAGIGNLALLRFDSDQDAPQPQAECSPHLSFEVNGKM